MFANVLYLVTMFIVAPMILWRMIRYGRYRRGVAEKILGLSSARAQRMRDDRECIWIHGVSVGEVNLLPGLARRLEQTRPDTQVVISTSTDTGYDLAVKHFGADRVFFCPLDFTWAVRRTLRNLAPTQLVLAELEIWPNLVRIADRQGCEVMIVNGRLSQRSASRYQRARAFTRPIFARLSWVGCQDESSLDRFAACGTPRDRLSVTGSMKFDDAPTSRTIPEVQSLAQWAGLDRSLRVWVVGSTQPGEEEMALDIYRDLRDEDRQLRLVLVPRHRERFEEVARMIRAAGLRVHRRSAGEAVAGTLPRDTVILVDTIGELRHWWGVAEIATVGGSFGRRGGQNMLEPAGYGCAVSFGPDTRNFKSIADRLIKHDAAVRVAGADDLSDFVANCLRNPHAAKSLGQSARDVVMQHRGATERTIEALNRRGSTRRSAA